MIWLIGNKGMLGSEVEAQLLAHDATFIATDREVDITRMESLHAFLRDRPVAQLRCIVNCAAYTAVDAAEQEPQKARALNAEGPHNLAMIARESHASLIHLSTDYIFDGNRQGEYSEEDPPHPLCTYGKSKLEGEISIRQALDQHVIIRTAWLYGSNGRNFVDTMLKLFREQDEVRVVNDQSGNPTYARDLANFISDTLLQKSLPYGTFHFTNEGKTTWFEFAEAIYKEARIRGIAPGGVRLLPVTTEEYPTQAHRPRNSCLSKEKIKAELGISIRHWSEALRDYLGRRTG